MARTGTANLPLHGGRVPPWLAQRMARLGRVIVEALVLEYGRDEVLSRLSSPFWFQSFGAVMGMDWHSSGITTSVISALRRGLAPIEDELGLYVCGGRGKQSRKTPEQLMAIAGRTGLNGQHLAKTSRLVAKVDSAAVQDGYELYLHAFIVGGDGKWTVVQQGMNADTRYARRYHWRSEGLRSFVDDPHAAIEGLRSDGPLVNLADSRALPNRQAQLELLALGPDKLLREVGSAAPQLVRPSSQQLTLPAHHDLRPSDLSLGRLHKTLAAAAIAGPRDFIDVLSTPNVGARTIATLAHVAEVIHGAPSRFSDPGRFSLALGGKDGHPFPVPLDVYDKTIDVLRHAVGRAKLGEDDRLSAIKRLDAQSRAIEAPGGPDLAAFISGERRRSHAYRGRTVSGYAKPALPTTTRQRSLFDEE